MNWQKSNATDGLVMGIEKRFGLALFEIMTKTKKFDL